jgi:hypothetical protein
LKLAFYGQAEAVMALIAPLAPEAQKEVLAAKGAVRGLVGNGQTEAVFALIAAFAPGEQKQLLDQGEIIWQLRENGELAALDVFSEQVVQGCAWSQAVSDLRARLASKRSRL